jgi:hypothetical protein
MLSIVMLSIVMLSIVMLSIVMLSVVILNVVVMSAVAPHKKLGQFTFRKLSFFAHFGTAFWPSELNLL